MINVILIIGARGQGKSSIAKSYIRDVHPSRLLCYDVQNEYGLDDYPDGLPDLDIFLNDALTMRQSVIICEEGTMFFSNRGFNKKMIKLLVNARHHHNLIFVMFHSIRSVPRYIYDMTNIVYLLKTNDDRKLVESKHDVLLESFDKVQKMPPTQFPKISYQKIKIQ